MSGKTIYALSTVNGKSGVAVVRISGDNSIDVIKSMTDLTVSSIESRKAYFINLKHSVTSNVLDKCLLIYFKSPYSFTGEDIIELQIHGSQAVIKSVLDSLSCLDNYRLAEPGEFSKRAFYNGKMDLTEAEGLADLIDAETEEQQKYALRQMDGVLRNVYDDWRERLLTIQSYLEAYIDFPEEEIPDSIVDGLLNDVFKLKTEIKQHLDGDNIGERLKDGFKVVIVGPPNAGKSSLLNAIVKRDAAIVSSTEGTTRDAIDVYLNLKGYPVIFTDTAGLRETEEEIEKLGIEIALNKASFADIVICLVDGKDKDSNVFDDIKEKSSNLIFVANKSDSLTSSEIANWESKGYQIISAKQNSGIVGLLDSISDKIKDKFSSSSSLIITRARYKEFLIESFNNLDMFNLDKNIEFAAEDVRLASRALGKITGQIEINEILDKIFGDFCIGK